MEYINNIKEVFINFGRDHFDEKNVTQLNHALQCAYLAEKENSTPALITASLLHDICLLYTSPSPRDATLSRMPSSA